MDFCDMQPWLRILKSMNAIFKPVQWLFISCILTVTGCIHKTSSISASKTPEQLLVENFYKRYFKQPKDTALPLSTSFQNLIDANDKACQQYGEGPCGWGSDGDVYLDTQEVDPNLSFENSGFTICEPKPHVVEVTFNVYPSLKNAYYDKDLQFVMIFEDGQWVVDDIITHGQSGRLEIQKEISSLLKNPTSK